MWACAKPQMPHARAMDVKGVWVLETSGISVRGTNTKADLILRVKYCIAQHGIFRYTANIHADG